MKGLLLGLIFILSLIAVQAQSFKVIPFGSGPKQHEIW